MAHKVAPTDRFCINGAQVLCDLDGTDMSEPYAGGTRKITMAIVLCVALLSDTKDESVTLDVLDRFILAKRFRENDMSDIRVTTCEQLKKLVAKHFAHAPLLAGQTLSLLGSTGSDL